MVRRLTATEQRILRHPPTTGTWECQGERLGEEGAAIVCGIPNAVAATQCWLCCTLKSERPRLLYPDYVEACGKAGIEPGDRWPQRDDTPEEPQPARTRRKGNR